MNVTIGTTVESLKAEGAYREAGALAAQQGKPCSYGCHYGMRSSRALAIAEFHEGYANERALQAMQAGGERLVCSNRIIWGQ